MTTRTDFDTHDEYMNSTIQESLDSLSASLVIVDSKKTAWRNGIEYWCQVAPWDIPYLSGTPQEKFFKAAWDFMDRSYEEYCDKERAAGTEGFRQEDDDFAALVELANTSKICETSVVLCFQECQNCTAIREAREIVNAFI